MSCGLHRWRADESSSGDPGDTDESASEASSSGGTGEGCLASDDCDDGLCFDGVCIPTDGACDSNADCNADTYCCDADCMPDDADSNWCVPYGEPLDTHNDDCSQDVVIGLFEPDVQCPDNRIIAASTPAIADLNGDVVPEIVDNCREVSCEVPAAVVGTITMVANDDGLGGGMSGGRQHRYDRRQSLRGAGVASSLR